MLVQARRLAIPAIEQRGTWLLDDVGVPCSRIPSCPPRRGDRGSPGRRRPTVSATPATATCTPRWRSRAAPAPPRAPSRRSTTSSRPRSTSAAPRLVSTAWHPQAPPPRPQAGRGEPRLQRRIKATSTQPGPSTRQGTRSRTIAVSLGPAPRPSSGRWAHGSTPPGSWPQEGGHNRTGTVFTRNRPPSALGIAAAVAASIWGASPGHAFTTPAPAYTARRGAGWLPRTRSTRTRPPRTRRSSAPHGDRALDRRQPHHPDASNVVAAFQVGRVDAGGDADNGFATSSDGGRTWTDGLLPGLTRDGPHAGPSLPPRLRRGGHVRSRRHRLRQLARL